MAKVMLVEDDNNLREIYQARLQAEGYDIVTAKDGEEALVVAKAEKPELVISDVMMPKISGFEMLDILRNTDGLKEVKVIMLTALGQSDDQQRADKLGADRYLVKSQVTLEDIVKTAHDLLEGETPASAVAATPPIAPAPDPAPEPVSVAPPPVAVPAPAVPDPAPVPTPAPAPAAPSVVTPPAPDEPATDSTVPPTVQTTAQEEAQVEAGIESFVAGASINPTPPTAPIAPPPVAVPAPAATSNDQQLADSSANDQLISSAADALTGTPAPAPVEPPAAVAPADAAPSAESPAPAAMSHTKVIQPVEPSTKKDINDLLAEEEAKQAASQPPAPPVAVVATDKEGITSAPAAPPATPLTKSDTPPSEDDPSSIAL